MGYAAPAEMRWELLWLDSESLVLRRKSTAHSKLAKVTGAEDRGNPATLTGIHESKRVLTIYFGEEKLSTWKRAIFRAPFRCA